MNQQPYNQNHNKTKSPPSTNHRLIESASLDSTNSLSETKSDEFSTFKRSPTGRSPTNRSTNVSTMAIVKGSAKSQASESYGILNSTVDSSVIVANEPSSVVVSNQTQSSTDIDRQMINNTDEQEQANCSKQTEQTEQDSPAFRLRARRSTPRKLNSFYSNSCMISSKPTSRNRNLYSVEKSDQLQAKVAKLKSGDVKRNLFESPSKPSNDDHESLSTTNNHCSNNRRTQHSPSRSLVEDVDLNVFAENVLVEKVIEGRNNLNYLCLRIIEVLDEEKYSRDHHNSYNDQNISNENPNHDQQLSNNDDSSKTQSNLLESHEHSQELVKRRLIKIYCQQAETKSVLNIHKPVVLLYLFDEYVDFKHKFETGKLIEIVKFEVKQLVRPIASFGVNSVPVLPFYIECKADRSTNWIPLISVKLRKKYEPTNLSLLNVINTQNKFQTLESIEDQPPTKNPRVIFSSYVVKTEPIENPNQNLHNTKSPTIKRFMKTINKSYGQESTKLKLKIKRDRS